MNRQPFDPAKARVSRKNVVEPDAESDRIAHEVIGAAIEVHRHLGPGHLESAYERALCIELTLRNVPFVVQSPVRLVYKGHDVAESRIDLLVADRVIVELKAVDGLAPIHAAQAMSYLKATGRQLALLINFNTLLLKDGVKRIIVNS